MPAPSMSRRTFLAAAGLGAAGMLGACDLATPPTTNIAPTFTPNPSPAATGPYQVGRVILGQDAVAAAPTDALPEILGTNIAGVGDPGEGWMKMCPDGTVIGPRLVPNILAAVYYPSFAGTDHRVPTPNPLHLTEGPFPVLLYAHAFREALSEGCIGSHTANLDFTSVEVMLRHVASYGCVCVVPDLSWIGGGSAAEGPHGYNQVVVARAQVLLAYFLHLRALNDTLFAHQLDLNRLVLAGHSTGGAAAVEAGRGLTLLSTDTFPPTKPPTSVAFGLIAPISAMSLPFTGISQGALRNVLVLKGSRDTLQVENGPEADYSAASPPKTFVTIPGANHFGYTDICPFDNSCATIGMNDPNGTITRDAQQLAGASYLTALVRYYMLGETSMRPYLTGEKPVEGLENFVTGIQVQSVGLPLSTPTPSRPTPAPNR